VECGNREEARQGITETVAILQMERIDGQTASSFLLLTFLLRKKKSKVNMNKIEQRVFNRTIMFSNTIIYGHNHNWNIIWNWQSNR